MRQILAVLLVTVGCGYAQTKASGQVHFKDGQVKEFASLGLLGWPAGTVPIADLSGQEWSYGKTVTEILTEHLEELPHISLNGAKRIEFHVPTRTEQAEINKLASKLGLQAGCQLPDPPSYAKGGCSIRKVSLFFDGGKPTEGIFVRIGSNKSPIKALGPEKQEYGLDRYDVTELVFGK